MTQLTKNTPVIFHFRYVELPWEFKTKGINRKLTHCGDKDFAKHSPFGGITVVYHPETKAFSVAVCSIKDNFNRKLGIKIAMSRHAAMCKNSVQIAMNTHTTMNSNNFSLYSMFTDPLAPVQVGGANFLNDDAAGKMKGVILGYKGEQTLQAVREAANRIANAYMEC